MKNKKSKSKLKAHQLRAEIAKFMLKNPDKGYNARQLIKKLDLKNSKLAVQDALQKLTEEKLLREDKGEKFVLANQARIHQKPVKKIFQGYVDMTKSGSAYIICDDLQDDVYVPARFLNGALQKDYVEIQLFQLTNRRRPEAEVLRVIQRSTHQFIGTLRMHGKQFFVIPDGLYYDFPIYIKQEDTGKAEIGDKVVVEVNVWPGPKRKSAEGRVLDVLGASGQSDIEMKTILINQGFELEFPDEVLKELKWMRDKIEDLEVQSRQDFRQVLTITIDPEDAKDFDDALSWRKLESGGWEVGVHIADVSFYVRPGTALDRDAFRRSTSVYLVDRVLPMLPEKLSNELCSLRPHEDKLTFSVVFEIGENYQIKNIQIGRTIIHSDKRFTYEEAQEIIQGKPSEFAEMILSLNDIAKSYRKKRFEQGAIQFESDEIKFKLDEEGAPIEIFVKERKEAHMLVEEFMLMANKAAAEFMANKDESAEVPFIYRVHDLPDMDKLRDLAAFARELGFKDMNLQTPKHIAQSLNRLAEAARKDDRLKLLEPLAIRTMAKAEYSVNNIGHYGLAFSHYTHFTSPIRRYSDLVAHRIIFDNLDKVVRYKKDELEFKCRHISLQERKAMDAERESIKYKQVEFMERFIGRVMEGVVTGMIDKGIFVELIETKCEGLIPFQHLSEPYHIESNRLKAKGLVSGRILKLGDILQVRVIDTNLERRELELDLVDD